MSTKEAIATQIEERRRCINAILSSKSSKKIVVAGAGTGKTYTFREILKGNPGGNNIALTFINSLTNDMASVLGALAEVKTFHAYCKKILHEQNGKVELYPFLTQIIEEDAFYLNLELNAFDKQFQILDEESDEIAFYLMRGDYYDAVSFNDSVYRLYKQLQEKPDIIPKFNQILIDEFQDFNPLEVAFINELENRGNVLIVGDDDQSVYGGRCASPDYLRQKYYSGEYEIFELPFCRRCPEVIVNAANTLISSSEMNGHLIGRVKKRFECYISTKEPDNTRFPNIYTARCTTGKVVAKYAGKVIRSITPEDIEESWREGSEYSSVLVTGPKQYLTIIHKELADEYPQMVYKRSEQPRLTVVDGYNALLNDPKANIGWRILVNFYFERTSVSKFIQKSEEEVHFLDILDNSFIRKQESVVQTIRSIKQGQDFNREELQQHTGALYDEIVEYYSPTETHEEEQIDKTKPSILLSSFVGCKGLSAGHVIIIGANNESIPRDPKNIRDIEIAQFLVALTRTRKQCHIVSNKWLIAPFVNGAYQNPADVTSFLSWINSALIENLGNLSAKDFISFQENPLT